MDIINIIGEQGSGKTTLIKDAIGKIGEPYPYSIEYIEEYDNIHKIFSMRKKTLLFIDDNADLLNKYKEQYLDWIKAQEGICVVAVYSKIYEARVIDIKSLDADMLLSEIHMYYNNIERLINFICKRFIKHVE